MFGPWRLIGIEFHRKYREGSTRLDLRNGHRLEHWGWFTLEWQRCYFGPAPLE